MREPDLYYQMLRIRRIEEEIARRYPQQKMRCPVHLSIGQEACAVGMCSALDNDDFMVSTHRGHAHYLAKGGSLRGLICELYGKADGCSRGQGGSMHLVDRDVGFCGSTSIVGGTIPVGVGLAFAKKLKKESGCVVVCIGDAAIEEGVFHESANFASLHKLPVIFLLENNFYSCYTHLRERQPDRPLFHVAQAHGLGFLHLNTTIVTEIAHKAKGVVAIAKQDGPQLFVIDTYRFLEHCGPNNDDDLGYRDLAETKKWYELDPLIRCSKKYVAASQVMAIRNEIAAEFAYAEAAPFPEQSELGRYLYAKI